MSNNKPISEYKLMFFSKLQIFNDKIVIHNFFGLNQTTIPIYKIASVNRSLTKGIIIETSGGHTKEMVLWNRKLESKVIDQILELANKQGGTKNEKNS